MAWATSLGIVDDTYADVGAMLSSLVIYLDANDAGGGFYTLAAEMGLLPRGASKHQKEAFWVGQMRVVIRRFEKSPG